MAVKTGGYFTEQYEKDMISITKPYYAEKSGKFA